MVISVSSQIGIIGMGRFGSLIAEIFQEDFSVYCYDPKNKLAGANNVTLECAASRDIVVYCVPIVNFEESIIQSLPYLKCDAQVIDVLSVKEYPYNIMCDLLPHTVSILPTHPMFGPDSIKKGRAGLPFVLCPEQRTNKETAFFFSNYFSGKGFSVTQTTCEEHDKITAKSLCLTQLIGRVIANLELHESEYDTENFRNLLKLYKTAKNDSIELFIGLQKHNRYAGDMREKLLDSLNDLDRVLKN